MVERKGRQVARVSKKLWVCGDYQRARKLGACPLACPSLTEFSNISRTGEWAWEFDWYFIVYLGLL